MSGWITEYRVACGQTAEALHEIVNQMIAGKWQPIGGIAVAGGVAMQAMAKIDYSQSDQISLDISELNRKTPYNLG